jgi:mannose-6-phosphate isomerase
MRTTARFPLLLRPDNFTPLQRTPWAGRRIGEFYKSKVCPSATNSLVGESWEFSCDPDFPSKLIDGTLLVELISEFPEAMLGKSWNPANGTPTCEILVKLINAADPLSLQIHPSDDDEFLKPGECGKPESWFVLDREPGAGLYLGFNQRLTRAELRDIISSGDRAKDVLQFVPVEPGDYFEIEPGVPHAIGPGVTLLEPQRIVFGKSGKTYRFWDWGRTYDKEGRVSASGKPRELHLEAALRLVTPETQFGEVYVDRLRRRPQTQNFGKTRVQSYPANPYYRLHVIDMEAPSFFNVGLNGDYGVATIIDGDVVLANEQRQLSVCRGHSLMVPASCTSTTISCTSPQARIALVTPAKALASWSSIR